MQRGVVFWLSNAFACVVLLCLLPAVILHDVLANCIFFVCIRSRRTASGAAKGLMCVALCFFTAPYLYNLKTYIPTLKSLQNYGWAGAALSRSGDLEINISYDDTLIGNCCAVVCLYMHVCRVSARIITFCLVGLANIPYTVMSCVIIWGSNLMIARLLDA